VTLVNYLQEAAIEASTALGLSLDWYRARGTGWVVRKLMVRCDRVLRYNDEVAVDTWISTARGVRSTREYEVRDCGGGERLARARAEWVYVDMATGQPTRLPEGWAEAFRNAGPLEDLMFRPDGLNPVSEVQRFVARRRVEFRELDTVRHVNHAVYIHWAEEARREALRSAGVNVEDGRPASGHVVQYFAPALGGDEIEIMSQLTEEGASAASWMHEILQAGSRKLLARVDAVCPGCGTFKGVGAVAGGNLT
jgi:acyl-CoA thioester hydrolase